MQQVVLFRQRGRCGRRNAPAIDVGALKAPAQQLCDGYEKEDREKGDEEEEEKFRSFT